MPALLHSDVTRLAKSIKHDFPELISLSSIGKTFEGRDIDLITLDAREPVVLAEMAHFAMTTGQSLVQTELQQELQKEIEGHFFAKPSVLLTGQHHSREHITVNTVMYSLLNLLHGGFVHHDNPEMRALLKEARYLFIPTVNVDGAAYIEDQYEKTGVLETKRKNMHFYPGQLDACGETGGGVDLNRNYGVHFDDRAPDSHKGNPLCNDQFNGPSAFSEPETQAMRDFLTSEKDRLNFVYNFHTFGNFFIFPYNFEEPNNSFQEIPQTMSLFQELIEEAEFPEEFKMGPASETVGFHTGGSSGDWINSHLGVPAAEVEIGGAEQINMTHGWMPPSKEVSLELVQQSWKWISHTFRKVGNQIHVKPIGYRKIAANYTGEEAEKFGERVELYLEVTNHGSSDQIHSDFKIRLENEDFRVVNSNTAYDDIKPGMRTAMQQAEINIFNFNGLKKRSKQVVKIPVDIKKVFDKPDLYDKYTGPLETVVRYREFFDTSSHLKAQLLNFPMMTEEPKHEWQAIVSI